MQAAQDVARTAAGKIGDGLFCQAVVGDHFLIPVETVLTVTITGAVTFTVQVHIHKTIAFGDAVARGEQVEGRPGIVAQQLHAVCNGSLHGLDVLTDVLNAVRIMDRTVFFQLIISTKAVFADHYRDVVAIVDVLQHILQADRVDGHGEVRITNEAGELIATFNGTGYRKDTELPFTPLV